MCNGICVLEKNVNDFKVKELLNGTSQAGFDYAVYATVRGGENREAVIVPESELPRSMDAVPETTEE